MIAALAAACVAVLAVIVLVATAGPSAKRSSDRGQGSDSTPATSLRILSVTPASGTAKVTGNAALQFVFSAPVAVTSAVPAISPKAAGYWQASGSTLTFFPSVPLAPSTRYSVTVPAGMRSAAGGLLAKAITTTFSTAAYSQTRLAELLSQLGYLPLNWRPAAGGTVTSGGGRLSSGASGGASAGALAGQEALAFSPPAGTFTWQPGYPASLHGQWQPGQPNALLRGAVMAFQAQHNMAINGLLRPRLWRALFAAAAAGQQNAVGYTYAVAYKGSPETLTIWHNGRVVLRSLTNTGISVAPTVSGTFPVYLRFRNTIMSGTNPDGSHYSDPVSFVSYFNGGDAVHYFPRGSYGWPQSLGCVELPYNNAQRAYPYLTYGSLVTVAG